MPEIIDLAILQYLKQKYTLTYSTLLKESKTSELLVDSIKPDLLSTTWNKHHKIITSPISRKRKSIIYSSEDEPLKLSIKPFSDVEVNTNVVEKSFTKNGMDLLFESTDDEVKITSTTFKKQARKIFPDSSDDDVKITSVSDKKLKMVGLTPIKNKSTPTRASRRLKKESSGKLKRVIIQDSDVSINSVSDSDSGSSSTNPSVTRIKCYICKQTKVLDSFSQKQQKIWKDSEFAPIREPVYCLSHHNGNNFDIAEKLAKSTPIKQGSSLADIALKYSLQSESEVEYDEDKGDELISIGRFKGKTFNEIWENEKDFCREIILDDSSEDEMQDYKFKKWVQGKILDQDMDL